MTVIIIVSIYFQLVLLYGLTFDLCFSPELQTEVLLFIQLHFLNCPKSSKDKNDIRKLFDCATLVSVPFLGKAFSSIVVMLRCDWLNSF